MKSTELELFTLFEMTLDLVCIAGKDGFFNKVNPAVIEKLGYTQKELFASPIDSFIHPDDREFTYQNRKDLLNGKALLNFENRYVAKSGDLVWLEWTSIYFPDKEIVFAIAKDVTERKKIEKEVEEKYKKYKGLTTHFKNKIENVKRDFAYELHEELAQLVAAVKMDVEWVANNETQISASSKSMIEHALAVSKVLIKTIQKISFTISPNMLDDFGLDTTMEWLCKEFSILNEIPCTFESGYDEKILTKEIKIDLFRICQESLANVIDHARANNVTVRIDAADGTLKLSIRDDGKGFDAVHKTETPGFINMKELVSSINGHLSIQSEVGEGTTICVTLKEENNFV